jgi:CSLREA domain-containing protein
LSGLTIANGFLSDDGGGILNRANATTITACHITGNTAGAGAGVYNEAEGTLIVSHSTISNNVSNGSNDGGGGIHNRGSLTLINSTLSGNVKNNGNNNGGGIWTSGAATITNSTVADNEAAGTNSAGGIYRVRETTTVRNSIVAANRNNFDLPDVVGVFQSGGYNLIGNAGATGFDQNGDQVGGTEEIEPEPLEPELDSLALNGGTTPTHALLPESPAIDKGKAFGSATDQRGQPRPVDRPNLPPATGGDHSDIGAFEAQAIPNAAPVALATPSSITINEDTSANTAFIAEDANADSLTLTITDQPDNGTISGFDSTPNCPIDENSTHCFNPINYTPNQNFNGTDSFSFKANDGQLDSNVVTVNITINPVDETPNAVNDSYIINRNNTLTVAAPGVLANDTDAENSPLTAILSSDASHGTVVLNANGSFTYTPVAGYSGADSFEYQANDGTSNSNVAVVNITVKAPLTVTKIADTNDGACDTDCSLREAIAAAASGGTIAFDPSTFNTPQIITLSEAEGFQGLAINKNLTILAPGVQLLTVRRASDATANFRIFSLAGNIAVNLNGMTIAGGNADGAPGGGISNISGAQLTVTNSHITGNNASFGGGIFNSYDGTVTLTGSTVSGNTSDCVCGGGAGINNDGTLTVTNSTISGNTKTNGEGNTAGGVYNYSGDAIFTNSTVADNQAPGAESAGGVFRAGGTVTIRSSIVAANRNNSAVPDVAGEFASSGYNLIGNVGGATGFTTTGDQTGNSTATLNPQISALGSSNGATPTHALQSNSPALDKGSSFGIATDQRGFLRPFDISAITNASDGADIGAFEMQVTPAFGIAGTVSYGTTPTGQATRNVSGVTLSASGSGIASTSTNPSGVYSLDNLAAGGQYTVTPSKTGNINSISPFDATLVLRCVAAGSGCTLTDNQKLAADTNNSNTVTPFDATQILRFVAANQQTNATGAVGNWRFNPVARNYSALNNSLSGENYAAILIGEVNGSWTPPTGNFAFGENQAKTTGDEKFRLAKFLILPQP